jgi:holliday junction DNA helicase RuvA
MIDFLNGKVKEVGEKTITLLVNGLGFQVHVSRPANFVKDKEIELCTYMHWNAENGPTLFGFQEELEKIVFLMIIDCPKIGPGIAKNILSQLSPEQFLEIVSSQNEKALSEVNGIGEKKAEQIIVQLKHKVAKLLMSGQIVKHSQQNFVQWQNINDVLVSLNYSKPEISKVMQFLTEKYSGQNVPLDMLIRSALSFLSGNI